MDREVSVISLSLKSVFYFSIILFWNGLRSQEPYHFFIGQDELSSVDIYGIHQTADGVYWIASDNGVYAYDGYEFTNYFHEKQLSNSVFNLTETSDGGICFNNLNGQIFKVHNDEISLLYQIPDSLISPYVSFGFLSEDEMVVHGRSLFKVNPQFPNEITTIFQEEEGHLFLSTIERAKNGDLVVHYWHDSITVLHEDEINSYAISLESYYKIDASKSLSLSGSADKLLFKSPSSIVYSATFEGDQVSLVEISRDKGTLSRPYITSNAIWFASNKTGVVREDIHSNREDKIFEDYFISFVFEDNRGNILIGTFDQGLIIIPPIQMENLIYSRDLNTSAFQVASDSLLYVGGADGHIYSWKKGKVDTLVKLGYKRVELLEYLPRQNKLLFDREQPILFDLNTGILNDLGDGSAIKDVHSFDQNTYYLSGNVATYCLRFYEDSNSLNGIFLGRSYTVFALDSSNFLIGSSKGLILLQDSKVTELKFEDNELLVSKITAWGDKILLGSKSYGLLEYKADGLSAFSNVASGLGSNYVRAVQSWKEYLILITDHGVEIVNAQGEKVGEVGVTDGLFSRIPNQMIVMGDYLYTMHNEGIQRLYLPSYLAFQHEVLFSNVEFYVNDQLFSKSGGHEFPTEMNNLEVQVFVENVELMQDLKYAYVLKGLEEEVHFAPYENNLISYSSLPPGEYTLEVSLVYKGVTQETRAFTFSIDYPFYQKWWFYVLSSLFLIFIVAVYFSYRIRAIKKRNAEKLSRESLEKNALEAQLKALRSQMNPHFIFNSLNSIQDLILQEDTDSSYDYIVLFSDLVRNTLNYSNQEFIDIEKELNFLEVYLSLEKLRFKEDFEYEINYGNDMDIQVPSLVVQPFIENALVHGLLHKEGLKKLSISFKMEEQLTCTIIDNGVGRDRSKEINSRQKHRHESFSMGAIKERMKILKEQYGTDAGFEIEDLFENGSSVGTKVVITMPFKRSFE